VFRAIYRENVETGMLNYQLAAIHNFARYRSPIVDAYICSVVPGYIQFTRPRGQVREAEVPNG
jgi:hypothetical protein